MISHVISLIPGMPGSASPPPCEATVQALRQRHEELEQQLAVGVWAELMAVGADVDVENLWENHGKWMEVV